MLLLTLIQSLHKLRWLHLLLRGSLLALLLSLLGLSIAWLFIRGRQVLVIELPQELSTAMLVRRSLLLLRRFHLLPELNLLLHVKLLLSLLLPLLLRLGLGDLLLELLRELDLLEPLLIITVLILEGHSLEVAHTRALGVRRGNGAVLWGLGSGGLRAEVLRGSRVVRLILRLLLLLLCIGSAGFLNLLL